MNGTINLLITAFSLAQSVAPLVPEIVSDAKSFTGDIEKVVADLSKKDASATLADVEAVFATVATDLPTVTKVLAASKALTL